MMDIRDHSMYVYKMKNGYKLYQIQEHILAWEEFYNKRVPKDYVIHHMNGDKLDNRIQNLQCCHKDKHVKFHNSGKRHNQAKYTLWDISKAKYDRGNMYNRGRKPNPCKCFTTVYNGEKVFIGGFMEPLSCEIIHDIIKQEAEND